MTLPRALGLLGLAVPLAACSPATAADPVPEVATATVAAADLPEGGAAGQRAPAFTVTDHRGESLVLSELLAGGPVVLLFYRGHW